MKTLTFIDTITGKEYEQIVTDRTFSSPELFHNKVEVLKHGVAQKAITAEWRKVHEYEHTGRVSDVWKDKEDSLRWYLEAEERSKYIVLKSE